MEGEALSLAKLEIQRNSSLRQMSVARVEKDFDVSVVLLRRGDEADMHPAGIRILRRADIIAILGNPDQISLVVHANH